MSDRRIHNANKQRKAAVPSTYDNRNANSNARKVRERFILPRDQAGLSNGSNLFRTYSHYDETSLGRRFGSSEVQKSKKSDEEREADRRRKNKENSRRMREKQKIEKEKMVKEYEANELRIKQLEIIADELSGELRRMNTAPSGHLHGSSSKAGNRKYDNEDNPGEKEARPSWFGTAF